MLTYRDKDYMKLAKFWGLLKSKDPSTKVGAVLVRPDNTIASLSYNGLPPLIKDTDERLSNRKFKLAVTNHAEDNALAFCNENKSGYTVYIWPCLPCPSCTSKIIRADLARVVCPNQKITKGGMNLELSIELLKEARIRLDFYNE
jgi:dCMP deaminase